MKNEIMISTILLLTLSISTTFESSYGQTTTTNNTNTSFLDCYSKNAANFLFASMFLPFTIDLTDPNMKKLISDMCNFYHEKTGKWMDFSKDIDIMQPYTEEFWDQYPVETLPKELLEMFKEGIYSK